MMTERTEKNGTRQPLLSIITPAYNESANLVLLSERIKDVVAGIDTDWEWIIIDDHSRDATFATIRQLAGQDPHIRGCRLARNSGSHTAIVCGLEMAKGDCAIIMAADLQDPPETIPQLLEKWREGAQVVWAVRGKREGESTSTVGFAKLYYWIMRRIVGLDNLPPSGADFFLLDRRVISAFCNFRESNASVLALLTWMGFRQDNIVYDKQARIHGKSGWSISSKIKLVVDSVTSFSFLPVRLMSIVGFVVALTGFIFAGYVVMNVLLGGKPTEGWSSLMVAILTIGGMQMLMMGVLGEYLWRALDESRGRPRYIIEDEVGTETPKQGRPDA